MRLKKNSSMENNAGFVQMIQKEIQRQCSVACFLKLFVSKENVLSLSFINVEKGSVLKINYLWHY
jgi:hypothetical protein